MQLETLDAFEKRVVRLYLVRVLYLAKGNVTKAAKHAGRNRTEFYRLLQRHGIILLGRAVD